MPGPRLLARRSTPWLAAVVAGLLAVMVALGEHFSGEYRAGRIDRALDYRLRDHLGAHSHVLNAFVDIVPLAIALACAALVVWFLVSSRGRLALLAGLGPLLTIVLIDVMLKPWFDRHLHGSLSFPSGHTAGATSFAAVVAIAAFGPGRPRLALVWRLLPVVGVGVFAVAVAVALVAAGDHYATDTIGGGCVGVAVVLGLALLVDGVARTDEAPPVQPTHETMRGASISGGRR